MSLDVQDGDPGNIHKNGHRPNSMSRASERRNVNSTDWKTYKWSYSPRLPATFQVSRHPSTVTLNSVSGADEWRVILCAEFEFQGRKLDKVTRRFASQHHFLYQSISRDLKPKRAFCHSIVLLVFSECRVLRMKGPSLIPVLRTNKV